MDYWRTTTRLEQALPRTRRIGVVEREMVPSKISILPTNSPTNLPTDSTLYLTHTLTLQGSPRNISGANHGKYRRTDKIGEDTLSIEARAWIPHQSNILSERINKRKLKGANRLIKLNALAVL